MKFNQLILLFSSLIIIIILKSCTSTSSISSTSEQIVNTNGVYIAINNNSNSFRKIGDSITQVKPIVIIRFLNPNKGIIIPDNITDNEIFDSIKIKKLFDWCLEFEHKNPSDKDFIYFKPNYINDSINFTQKSPEANFVYDGINFKDSLVLSYKTVNLSFPNNPNKKPKFLHFKYYALN